MEKSDPFSFRSDPWDVVDELNSRSTAALERSIQIVDREADVMQPRPSLRDEAPDGGIGVPRLEQLHQRTSGVEARYAGAVGIIQIHLLEPEDITKKRHAGAQRLYSDADVGYADSARGCWGH